MKFIFGLLSFVTVGLIIGISLWKNDKEAEILRIGYIKPEVLSWSLRIILLHNFLSTEAIEKRISFCAEVPIENGEQIQLLRYENNQYYIPHNDYFTGIYNLKQGGQRIATMLMYLSDNVEGGETYFPAVDFLLPEVYHLDYFTSLLDDRYQADV